MSEKTEVELFRTAPGDPCIPETPLSVEAKSETVKIDSSEIKTITDVESSNAIPLENVENIAAAVQQVGNVGAVDEDKVTIPETTTPLPIDGNDSRDERLINLQEEVQKRTNERDDYEKKLADTEKKLSILQSAFDAASNDKRDEMTLRREMEELKNSLAQSQSKLNDRGRLMANQENQINALTKQVSSLKEVVAITKNLLEIRNMEVKHLQDDVDSMESRITAERERHNAMLRKMDAAVRLNADLKTEYETQLRLFQDLRGKYEEKVTLLTAENKAAACAASTAAPAEPTVQPALQ